MADFNSSLPVRTQNNGDLVINVADGTTETQLLSIDSSGRVTTKLDDGNGNAITSQANGAQRALDVGIDVAGVQIDPRSIRALTSSDVVTSNQGTAGSSYWLVQDIADGSVGAGTAATKSMLTGLVYNSAALTLTTGQQASLQGDVNANLKVNLVTPLPAGTNAIGSITNTTFGATQSGSWTVTANQGTANVTPWNENISQFGGNAVVTGTGASGVGIPRVTVANDSSVLANIQVSGAAVSVSNPVPVTLTAASPGTAIQSYSTVAALAAGSSTTITYTVAASHTFSLERIWTSASGKIKASAANGASVIFVGFNSTANPNIDFTVVAPPTIAAAGTVNVTITNEDKAAFDVYCTIEGNQN